MEQTVKQQLNSQWGHLKAFYHFAGEPITDVETEVY